MQQRLRTVTSRPARTALSQDRLAIVRTGEPPSVTLHCNTLSVKCQGFLLTVSVSVFDLKVVLELLDRFFYNPPTAVAAIEFLLNGFIKSRHYRLQNHCLQRFVSVRRLLLQRGR